MSYEITLQSFQGPLDLLLHLIEKNKVDIYDIPISEITTQYMEYINQWSAINLEVASEFLVMAATLLEIKSKLLLPDNEEVEEQLMMDEADPRQELIQKLIEYKKYKHLSIYFKDREKNEGKVIYKDPEYFPEFQNIKTEIDIEVDLLFKAFKNILLKKNMLTNDRRIFHNIERDNFTVEEKMNDITKQIQDKDFLQFSMLFNFCKSRNELITTFLAILELIKMKKIIVKQEKSFEDFLIVKRAIKKKI